MPNALEVALRRAIQQACNVSVQPSTDQRQQLHQAAKLTGRALTEVRKPDGESVWYAKSLHDQRPVAIGAMADAAALLFGLAAGGAAEGR